VLAEPQIVEALSAEEIGSLFDIGQSTGFCAQMVDRVLAQAETHEPAAG
jgi:hypothetical protein